MRRAKPKERVLKGVQANAGTTARYARCLVREVARMASMLRTAINLAYKGEGVGLAFDAPPKARDLEKAMRALRKRWTGRFNKLGEALAKYFATEADERVKSQLKRLLASHGISVKFKLTDDLRQVLNATIAEQVSLIKSIPEQYLTQVEGAVMRSVAAGRNLESLYKELRKIEGVTKRRAKLIARDQNAKATGRLNDARRVALGITEGIWHHSHAGKEPRPTHVKNDGKRYDLRKGWYDPAVKQWIKPGELINCRCYSSAVLPF